MKKILSATFFDRPVIRAAKNLLGKYLVRRWREKEISLLITEVEVYDGSHDLASHASRGQRGGLKLCFAQREYFTFISLMACTGS